MVKTIDYFFSLISPWAYLGSNRLRKIAHQSRATINYMPVRVLDIFAQSGGLPLGQRAPQRQAYRLVELDRWKKQLNIPLNTHPKFFPADESLAARVVIAAKQQDQNVEPLVSGIMTAVWAEDRDISDKATLNSLLSRHGFDGDKLIVAAENPDTLAQWSAYTEDAIERQVFGVPAYFFEGVLYWGQDRLDFLRQALMASSNR